MTAKTPVFRHPGPRPAALAERLAASLDAAARLEPASRAPTTAFAVARPTLAIAAASSIACPLTSRHTDPRREARCPVVDEAARVDGPASGMAALGIWAHDETANDKTPRLAGPRP